MGITGGALVGLRELSQPVTAQPICCEEVTGTIQAVDVDTTIFQERAARVVAKLDETYTVTSGLLCTSSTEWDVYSFEFASSNPCQFDDSYTPRIAIEPFATLTPGQVITLQDSFDDSCGVDYVHLGTCAGVVANTDGYVTDEDVTLTVPAPGVLENDVDGAGGELTATLTSAPSEGAVTLNADGSFTYTPEPEFSGQVTFGYEAANDEGGSDRSFATITVVPVNDAPVASDDAYGTELDTSLSVDPPGVLGNDLDPEGDSLTAGLVSGPSHGALVLDADGSFTYTPDPAFVGEDGFEYEADDGKVGTATATATITVVAPEPLLRLPDGLSCGDVQGWTVQIQGNDPVATGVSACAGTCDEYRVTLKPPVGGPSEKTTLCGDALDRLSGQKYVVDSCRECLSAGYASVGLRPVRNRSS